MHIRNDISAYKWKLKIIAIPEIQSWKTTPYLLSNAQQLLNNFHTTARLSRANIMNTASPILQMQKLSVVTHNDEDQ